jgi:hypothetical protein
MTANARGDDSEMAPAHARGLCRGRRDVGVVVELVAAPMADRLAPAAGTLRRADVALIPHLARCDGKVAKRANRVLAAAGDIGRGARLGKLGAAWWMERV